jgi:hypothetical protein
VLTIITPTRLSISRRLHGAVRAAYIRALIRAAEADIRQMESDLQHALKLPAQIGVHRRYIAELRVQLIAEGAL